MRGDVHDQRAELLDQIELAAAAEAVHQPAVSAAITLT